MKPVAIFLILFIGCFHHSASLAAWQGGVKLDSFVWERVDQSRIKIIAASASAYGIESNRSACDKTDTACGYNLAGDATMNIKFGYQAMRFSPKTTNMVAANMVSNLVGQTFLVPKVPGTNDKLCLWGYDKSRRMEGISLLNGVCSSASGVPPKPPIPTCSISANDINHGTLAPGELDGHTQSSSVTIRCDGDATVKLKVSNYNFTTGVPIIINKLYSRLFINGSEGEKVVLMRGSGAMSIPLTSTLKSTGGVAGGDYSAAVTIVSNVL